MGMDPLFGPYGTRALEYASELLSHGCNAAWFHGFNEAALNTCARHRIAACVECKTFRANYDERPELVPIGVDGAPLRRGRLFQGVCLSQSAFLAETEAALVEGLRAYRPAGIWLDYLTYGGWFEVPDPDLQESCFCPSCIQEFCQATGIDAATPQEILARHSGPWERHKCERIASFARRYAEIIRSRAPDTVIGAYMCSWTPSEFDGALTRIFAQDYALLAPFIDVFTPLIYARKSGRRPEWGAEYLDAAVGFVPSNRKVQLILDVLDFPESLQAVARSPRPSWGLQMFGGAEIFSDGEKAGVWADAVAQVRRRIEGG